MLEMLGAIIAPINSWLYYPILIILLLGVGIYFTVRSGFLQVRLLGEAFRVTGEKPMKEGDVSSFQTLMVTTASRVERQGDFLPDAGGVATSAGDARQYCRCCKRHLLRRLRRGVLDVDCRDYRRFVCLYRINACANL